MMFPNESRYAAFIITFRRPQVLQEMIRCLGAQSIPPELILVIDNGHSRDARSVTEEPAPCPVEYLAMIDNLGPAGAAHHALKILVERGYPWIYWGDDDDPPRHPDTIERLLALVSSNKDERIGALGEVGQRFDWRIGKIARLSDAELSGTAGALSVDVIAGDQQLILNAYAVKQVGLPKPELFFGFEEPELCLRLRRAGYILLVDRERMKAARISAGRFGRKIKTSSIGRPTASLWRNYYGTRNYIYLMRKSFRRPDLAARQIINEMAKSLFSFRRGVKYGVAFSHMSLLGVAHGLVGKMGKTIEPQSKPAERK